MRVMVCSGIYPPDIGGPATHAADLATELRVRGHEAHVLTLTDEHDTQRGVVTRLPRRWPMPLRLLAVVLWLVRHRKQYDVLYATGMQPEAVLAAKLAGRPIVVKIVGDAAWERSRRLGLTTSDFDDFDATVSASARVRAMRGIRNWTIRQADAVLTPSQYLAEAVERWTGRGDVTVVPNGVALREELPERPPTEHLRLLFVGRLVSWKRVDLVLDGLAGVEHATLEIVGEGPERDALGAQVARLGLGSRVAFLGALPHEEVLRRQRAADAMVLVSEYEGLPHAAIEALVVGTPLVASAAGGIGEVVEDGVNGILLGTVTGATLADAFGRLAASDDLRASLGAGAVDTGRSWRFEATVDGVERLLRRLVPGGRPPVVFLGKTRLSIPPSPTDQRKYAFHGERLHQTSYLLGPRGVHEVDGVRMVCLPTIGPGMVTGALFYTLGPLLAVARAVRLGGAPIVCQSPFEAVGVVTLRRLVPRRRRPRVQVELHGDWRTAARLYGGRVRKVAAPVADAVAAWALRRAERVRPVSTVLADLAVASGYQGPIDRYIAYADYTYFLREPAPFPTHRQVAFVGVLEPYKAVDVLLKAWSEVVASIPDARLVLAGDGVSGDSFRAQATDLGLDASVTFLGHVGRDAVAELLDDSVCLVLPSRSEGLARILVEAMSRERMAVASLVGGVRELIDDTNGVLVEADDVDGLAQALIGVLRDLERTRERGIAARVAIERRDPLQEYRDGIDRLVEWIGPG